MATSLTTGANGQIADPFAGLFSGSGMQGLTQLLQAAFGGKTNSSGNQNSMNSSTSGTNSTGSSVQNGSSQSQTQQILDAITNATRNSSASGSSSSVSESPLALQALAQVLPQLQAAAGSGQYSRENAIKDSQGGVMELFRNLQENALPGVFSAENASGGYNSTSKKLLSNDLMSRTVAQGQSLIADNVARYGTLANQQQTNLLNAINAAANASKVTTGATNSNTNDTSQSTVNQTNTGTTNTTNTNQTDTTNASTTNTQSQGNVATVSETNNQGLASNPGVQTAAGVIAVLSGLSSLGLTPSAIAALARSMGFGAASVNTDGTINWGDFKGAGDQGGFVGDPTDPTQGFGAPPDLPDAGSGVDNGSDLGGSIFGGSDPIDFGL